MRSARPPRGEPAGRDGADTGGRDGPASRRPTGVLLDPCCGQGTILSEALAAGWSAEGTDIDPAAVEAARPDRSGGERAAGRRARAAAARRQCRRVRLTAAGHVQRPLPGGWQVWAGTVLSEQSRVTRTGGAVVVLAPELARGAIPGSLRLRKTVPVGLAGAASVIWAFRRA